MGKIAYFFKDTKPSGQLAGWCLLLLLGFVLSAGVSSLMPASQYYTATDVRIELLMQGVGQLLMFFVPAVLFAVLFDGRPMSYLKVCTRWEKWMLGLCAMLLVLLLTPLCDRLTIWNRQLSFGPLDAALRSLAAQSQSATERLLSLSTSGDLLLQLLVVALVPAICEEMFFRGCLQQLLCGWMESRHLAVAVTAVVFALAHGDAFGFLPRLLLGLLLGYAFAYSGSIIVSICAHFFNNAVIVVLYFLYHREVFSVSPAEPLGMSWLWVAMCTVGAALVGYQYFVKQGRGIEH